MDSADQSTKPLALEVHVQKKIKNTMLEFTLSSDDEAASTQQRRSRFYSDSLVEYNRFGTHGDQGVEEVDILCGENADWVSDVDTLPTDDIINSDFAKVASDASSVSTDLPECISEADKADTSASCPCCHQAWVYCKCDDAAMASEDIISLQGCGFPSARNAPEVEDAPAVHVSYLPVNVSSAAACAMKTVSHLLLSAAQSQCGSMKATQFPHTAAYLPEPACVFNVVGVLPPPAEHSIAAQFQVGLPTTVMMRNLPGNYNRERLRSLIESKGFKGFYDFLYIPIDFKNKGALGYAFVNLINHDAANRFYEVFQNFCSWGLASEKKCEVRWSELQGLEHNVEKWKNSPVMHEDVAEELKPLLFSGGIRVAFPPPTKKLRLPHLKDCHKARTRR